MNRRIFPVIAAACLAALLSACAGEPPPPEPAKVENPVPEAASPARESVAAPAQVPVLPTPAAEPFDPMKVSAEVKTATITDIRALIENLNRIIQRQDYNSWRANLTDEYVEYYSNPTLLAQYSEYPILKRQEIKLSNLRDYFLYLVYPSRQNDRVDDIDFVGENLVKAITVSPKGSRDILYILEKHGDTWKIGIGR